jgi:hypothetical protein
MRRVLAVLVVLAGSLLTLSPAHAWYDRYGYCSKSPPLPYYAYHWPYRHYYHPRVYAGPPAYYPPPGYYRAY